MARWCRGRLFFTAIGDPAAIEPMLMEILTVGVSMAALVTAAWACLILVVESRLKARRVKGIHPVRGRTVCA